jgi:cell division protein FtsB
LNKQLIDRVKEVEQTLLDRETDTHSVSDDISKTKKEIQRLTAENKQLKQDKKKYEYLERECQIQREKYDNLKTSSTQFEQAA